jgi:hypothetical protein
MLTRHDVVHLVAMEAVVARHDEQPGQHEAGDQDDRPRDGERPESPTRRRGERRRHVLIIVPTTSGI